MRIAISGFSGCGNTTVSRMVAERLGCVQINYTFRNLAEELGLPFEELRKRAESDDSFDIRLDRRQVELAMGEENCVLASRLAIWNLADASLKVFLDISAEERARRVCRREGGEYDKWYDHTVRRDEADTARYKRIYNIDNRCFSDVADLVISDDGLSAGQIVDMIVGRVRSL